ncbi:glycine zipper 2TM domain-containing protein [Ferriphaselus sp. R-1]|uniref:glycine zipper 2TM domain-containing protein n=1 Tax=Ferriphaselus sp. R-1 TaxID=1485544 RepID=UPI00068B5D36|nr:glycine zipper 2TM domain-containing protein [Ferriphaselus sp. R-1]
MSHIKSLVLALAATALLAGSPASFALDAAAQPTPDKVVKKAKKVKKPKAAPAQPVAVCKECGTVSAITEVEKQGEGTGLGAIGGGVVGGLLGNQVGGGTGNDIATIAGAVGGAYVGHQVEKKVRTTVQFNVVVKMEDGSEATITEDKKPALAVGDKVKVVDGKLVR